jgi:hypothetical protein
MTQDKEVNEQDILDKQFLEEDAKAEAETKAEAEKSLDEKKENQENKEETIKTEDSLEEKPVKERPVYTMPVAKAQEEKRKAVEKARLEAEEKIKADYEAKIESMRTEYEAKLSQGKSTSGVDERLRKFAEEKGLDVEAANGLLDIFKQSIQLPDLTKYDALVKQQEIDAYKSEVSREFDAQVVPLIKKDFPSVSESHLNKIKQEIEQLAFTKQFNTYRIADIYKVNKDRFEFKNSYTAEDTGGRTDNSADISNLTEEEAMKLPAEQYVVWMDAQAKKQSLYVNSD